MEMRTISTKRMSNALHYLFLFSKDTVIGLDYVYISRVLAIHVRV